MTLTEDAINSAYRSTISALFNQLINAVAGGDSQALNHFEAGLKLAKDVRDKALSVSTSSYYP